METNGEFGDSMMTGWPLLACAGATLALRTCVLAGITTMIGAFSLPLAGAEPSRPLPPELSQDGLLEPNQLPGVWELPDSFRRPDGSRLRDPAGWPEQRRYLVRQILGYKYGLIPSPADLTVRREETGDWTTVVPGTRERPFKVTIERRLADDPKGRTISFDMRLIVPSEGQGPWPVLVAQLQKLGGDTIGQFATAGVAVAMFNLTQVSADDAQKAQGFYQLYPECDCGVLAAWAWGYHRTIDALTGYPGIDVKQVAVQGFSRVGMASLLAGALDERIGLTVTGGSNVGGVHPVRLLRTNEGKNNLGDESTYGTNATGLNLSIDNCGPSWPNWYWYGPRYRRFVGKEMRLPMDSHMAIIACAPRAVLISEGRGDKFGLQGYYDARLRQSILAAKLVYRFLGAEDKLLFRSHPGGHGVDWKTISEMTGWYLASRPKPTVLSELDPMARATLFTWSAP